MRSLNSLSISSLLILISLFSTTIDAATFNILNNCPYPVWAAALPGGGQRIDRGLTWALHVKSGTNGVIWGRTNCSFNNHNHGTCLTGDCGNLFQCIANGTAPKTTAEYSLNWGGLDSYRISLVDGYNVPMEFQPENSTCHGIQCSANILGECPNDLKRPGGCINPCTLRDCGPTQLTRFFKQRCPDTYTFPGDRISTFTCGVGTNYRVMFCP